jgi:ligand-binding sensor domain-containing protein
VTDILSVPDARGGEDTVVATNAGLTFMNGEVVSSIYAFQGLVNNHVYTIAQSGSTLWAGTLGGVSLLKNAVVQSSFTTANSNLSQNWITASVAVGDDVFLGTYGSGVILLNSHYDVEVFREFSKRRVEINANAMIVTNRGIYAGTAGQGLAFLPKGEQRWRFWTAGLPSANVTALTSDGNNLYVGTDNGLVRFPERDLTI